MKIDLAMLRGLEREREIPFEELASIIEQAIHTAYIKHEVNIGHPEPSDDQVRVVLDRKMVPSACSFPSSTKPAK